MSAVDTLPRVRGRLTPQAPFAPLVWFKAGGRAEWLFEPKDGSSRSFSRTDTPGSPI